MNSTSLNHVSSFPKNSSLPHISFDNDLIPPLASYDIPVDRGSLMEPFNEVSELFPWIAGNPQLRVNFDNTMVFASSRLSTSYSAVNSTLNLLYFSTKAFDEKVKILPSRHPKVLKPEDRMQ